MTYPIKLKASATFIAELNRCESGRWQDAEWASENDDWEEIKASNYELVFCDFGERHKTIIEIQNDAELHETWYALASGTIGLYHCRTANRLLDELRPLAKSKFPEFVEMWPYQNGY